MKFNELLNSIINEQEGAALEPLNPTRVQLETYFSRALKNEDDREKIIVMLADIFTESEAKLLAAVEEYYQTIRSKAMGLQQRNAPVGRAKVASNRAKQTNPTGRAKVASNRAKQANPAAPQPKANNKFPGPPSDKFHPAI